MSHAGAIATLWFTVLFTVIGPARLRAITQCQRRLWRSQKHRPTQEELLHFLTVIHPLHTESLQRNPPEPSSTGRTGCVYAAWLVPLPWPSMLSWPQAVCGDMMRAPLLVRQAGNLISGCPRAAQIPCTRRITQHRPNHCTPKLLAVPPQTACLLQGPTSPPAPVHGDLTGTRGESHLLLILSKDHTSHHASGLPPPTCGASRHHTRSWHHFVTCKAIAPHPPHPRKALSTSPDPKLQSQGEGNVGRGA